MSSHPSAGVPPTLAMSGSLTFFPFFFLRLSPDVSHAETADTPLFGTATRIPWILAPTKDGLAMRTATSYVSAFPVP